MVSVIIPTYNREKTILRAVSSVLNQTYGDLELIVVDDCSTDKTEEIVKSIEDSRVIFVKLEKNSGACVARNTGIAMARGEYIAFQDSDDEWLSNKLEKQLEYLNKTGADVTFHKVRQHFPDSDELNYFPHKEESGFVSHLEISNISLVTTQSIVGKKEVFGHYLFDPAVKKMQDYDWAVRASKEYKFYYISEILVEQYHQNESLSAQGYEVVIRMRQYFLEKYKEEMADNPAFELFHLRAIAQCKTLIGENAADDFRRCYEISGDRRDLMRHVLCKSKILYLIYKLKLLRARKRDVMNHSEKK